MKSITKIILGLVGLVAVGLITYLVVMPEKKDAGTTKPATMTKQEILLAKQHQQDSLFEVLKQTLNIGGEEFNKTAVEGVYTNAAKDKMLLLNEDIWKKLLKKTQKTFPKTVKSCNAKYTMPELESYRFVGLLTYLAESESSSTASAYTAIEIRNGRADSFAGGNLCCDCEEGEPLVAHKVDAVIVK